MEEAQANRASKRARTCNAKALEEPLAFSYWTALPLLFSAGEILQRKVQKQVFLRSFVLSRGISSSFLFLPQHDVIGIYLHTTLGELGPCKNQILVRWQLSSARPLREPLDFSAPLFLEL